MVMEGKGVVGGSSALHLLVVVVDISEAFSRHSTEEGASQGVSNQWCVVKHRVGKQPVVCSKA